MPFELPHITTYKRRWVRRLMILVTLPQEWVRALYYITKQGFAWWNWEPPQPPPQP